MWLTCVFPSNIKSFYVSLGYKAKFMDRMYSVTVKKTIIITGIALASFFSSPLMAQYDCRVLLAGIAGTYTGECKKGLADGEGVAIGNDIYRGTFKKGLPEGEGTYIWDTGEVYRGQWKRGMRDGYGTFQFRINENDTIQPGYWKEDVFIGSQKVTPYVVLHRIGIPRTSFFKQGSDEKRISFKFSRSGGASFNMEGLMMQGSSGSESVTTAFTGFINIIFPFEGKVQFRAPNIPNTVINNYELRFVINEPGDWVVTIYY